MTETTLVTTDTALTNAEAGELTQHEATIERGLKDFIEVGNALATIRDSQLYREHYRTFDDYCRGRWALGRAYAYQLMGAAQVAAKVSAIADTPAPSNEAQARPLTKLPEDKWIPVWEEAVKTAPDGRVTADHVRAVVERHIELPPPSRSSSIKLPTPKAALSTISDRLYYADPKKIAKTVDPSTCYSVVKKVRQWSIELEDSLPDRSGTYWDPPDTASDEAVEWAATARFKKGFAALAAHITTEIRDSDPNVLADIVEKRDVPKTIEHIDEWLWFFGVMKEGLGRRTPKKARATSAAG